MTNSTLIAPEEADAAVWRALTLFIGRGRRYSVEDVATGTGIPGNTIAKWLTPDPLQRRRPKGCHLLLVAQFIGVAFTNKLLGPIGQGGRELEAADDAPGRVIARLAAASAKFAELGADGAFDHVDRGKLEPFADDMIEVITPFSSRKT